MTKGIPGGKTLLRLLGSLVLLSVLAWRLDWRQLGSAFLGADLRACLAALAVYLLAQAVSARRWQRLAQPLGFSEPYPRFLSHYFVGMFYNLVLPTSVGGDVIRALYLDAGSGRRPAALFSAFLDRASGLLVLVALACVAALCCPTPLPGWLWTLVAGLGGATVAGVVALPLLPSLFRRLPGGGGRLTSLAEAGVGYLGRPAALFEVTGLALLVQLLNVVLVWFLGLGLGLSVPFAYYAVLMSLVALLTLLPSIGGLGVREVGTVTLLAPFGVPAEQAVTFGLLQFAIVSTAGLVGGGFYLFDRLPAQDSDAKVISPDKVTEEPECARAA